MTQYVGGRLRVVTKPHRAGERLLVIDASLTSQPASRLRERGRQAIAVKQRGWKDLLDPDLLRNVFGEFPDAVLVTYDDRMPHEHPVVIAEVGATIATVEAWDRRPRSPHVIKPDDLSNEEVWKREVVQRWAHSMALQESGSIRRYSRHRPTAWAPRIRNPQGRLFKSSPGP